MRPGPPCAARSSCRAREPEWGGGRGSGEETAARIKAAAGLFPTLNVDLIFNQAHQTQASLERDLDIFLGLGANQVSCYPLMTAPSVKRRMENAVGVPDQDRERVDKGKGVDRGCRRRLKKKKHPDDLQN